MNKRGITLVEVVVSIGLISVVMLFLFNLLIDMQFEEDHASFSKKNQVARASIIKLIQNDFMNLNGRISIFYSFVWGIIAILFINHIQPFFEMKLKKILRKIPYLVQLTILKIVTSIILVDTILSCIRYL